MRFVSAATRGLRRAGAVVASAIPPLLRDAIGILGAASVTFGVWQIHRPSAWIVAGVMMLIVAIRLSIPPRPPKPSTSFEGDN